MRSEQKRYKIILRWVLIVLAVIGALAIVLTLVIGTWIGSASGMFGGLSSGGGYAYSGPNHAYIAKISVVGEISGAGNHYASSDAAYHHDWTMKTIDTLIGDDNNKAIYLYLNTPGGTVYESDAFYLKLMEYKAKTGRPVFAYMGQMAASGGYYIASAADYIYANRNTWTGSIGVTIGTMFDVSGFLEEHGIKTETITSGRNKAMGGYYDPMTTEQKKIFQGLVDDAYGQFVGIVAEGRGMDEKKIRELADGRIYTASQALSNGLIDEILGQTEAEDAILEKVGEDAEIDHAYYRAATTILSSLGVRSDLNGLSAADAAPAGDVSAVLGLLERQTEIGAPEPMYLFGG
ncbi:peptidase [Clostridia bacterium]|nr:peptidase [Clostridia bacterium]